MGNNSEIPEKWRSRLIAQLTVDVLIWLAAACPVLYLFLYGTPHVRGFFCDDASLSYPYQPDTISSQLLVLGGFAISVFVVVMVEVFRCLDNRCTQSFLVTNDIFYCIKGYGVFLVGFVIEQFVGQLLKKEMGALRPNFFDVCKPQFNRTFCPGYITNYTCTGDPEEVRESRQSFPSGHASFSMFVAIYFCMYIQYRLEIKFSSILKFFMQTSLVVIATLCGLTRIKDHKHHPSDVAAGFLLGISLAVFVYNMIGKKVIPHECDNESDQWIFLTKSHDCDCSTAHAQEVQTPQPLLKSDFLNMGYEKTPTTPLLTDSPFSVRQPLTLPVRQPLTLPVTSRFKNEIV